jgi:hypothetical protein
MKESKFRAIALSFEGTTEAAHFDRRAFKVHRTVGPPRSPHFGRAGSLCGLGARRLFAGMPSRCWRSGCSIGRLGQDLATFGSTLPELLRLQRPELMTGALRSLSSRYHASS